MSKTLSLTIGERLAAIRIFDAFKGGMSTLAALLEDVKQLSITEDEWKKADLVKTQLEDGKESWKWSEEGSEKEVTLQDSSVAYLAAEIKRKSDAEEITLADVALLSLDTKLK